MPNLVQWLITGAVGIGSGIVYFFSREKTFDSLKHCKVSPEWVPIRDRAWEQASLVLHAQGLKKLTRCLRIKIEKGIKLNPKTGQWGRPTKKDGKEFWYAGRATSKMVEIVGTDKAEVYSRSQAIFTHEVAENILASNNFMQDKPEEERNLYLWSLGL